MSGALVAPTLTYRAERRRDRLDYLAMVWCRILDQAHATLNSLELDRELHPERYET